jgi:hypothetical protein
MKLISVSVSKSDYEAFRAAAESQGRSIAQLIRDAMALYRTEKLQRRTPLQEIPVLAGHKPLGRLPERAEIYEAVFARETDDER